MNLLHRQPIILLVVLLGLGLNACGSGETRGGETKTAPRPQPYPGAKNVSEERQLGGNVRIKRFQTQDQPETVLAFYKDVLPKQGWKLRKTYPDGYSFSYVPDEGAEAPAYDLVITVSAERVGQTAVELRQNISGPFNWVDP